MISYDAVRLTSLIIITKIKIDDYMTTVGVTEKEVNNGLNRILNDWHFIVY